MPLYIIERHFAEQLELTKEDVDAIKAINFEEESRWLLSFLSPDKKKTFCLYEAPSIQAIQKAAARAGVPADVITEVTEIHPEAFV
jgi:Nickel responsive protein SCO4226-like